ncbi:uncharacterized protein LOC112505409 [Cynara cardunculus var. scolymus]|uniref:uncharacterized protein LOC112505409 n=1 Tax=Cynara cardunculus var. scolymus TaxID=59895 RepID=UPI000D62940E|nr:uncharacterized protein LOC112505409 [Cynara cardunculus var. scolymus]
MVRKEKVISASVAKGSMPSLHKPLHSKPAPSVHKKPVAQKRDDRESSKGNVIAKKPVLSSKPQIKQQPAKLPPSAQQKERLKKRPVRSYSDDEHDDRAISMIRSMFRYNPSRYRGVNDDDDSDMEAGFDDIMMEEKRRSVSLQKSLGNLDLILVVILLYGSMFLHPCVVLAYMGLISLINFYLVHA